jgi:hypothetical protein
MLLRDETLTALGTFDLLRVDAAEFVRPIEHPHFGQRVLSDALTFSRLIFCFWSLQILSRQGTSRTAPIPARDARFGEHPFHRMIGRKAIPGD